MLEQKNSVMEQCEQCGRVCWNSGTVHDMERCKECKTEWCCQVLKEVTH